MSTLGSRGTISAGAGIISPFTKTSAAPQTSLASPDSGASAELWCNAVERMLAWRSHPERFEPDDAPTIEVLDTAIDYAEDERGRSGPAPTSIVPSGDGRVAFEWCDRGSTMIVEFVGRGRARYTIIDAGKVVKKGVLVRNPLSRKLELGS